MVYYYVVMISSKVNDCRVVESNSELTSLQKPHAISAWWSTFSTRFILSSSFYNKWTIQFLVLGIHLILLEKRSIKLGYLLMRLPLTVRSPQNIVESYASTKSVTSFKSTLWRCSCLARKVTIKLMEKGVCLWGVQMC